MTLSVLHVHDIVHWAGQELIAVSDCIGTLGRGVTQPTIGARRKTTLRGCVYTCEHSTPPHAYGTQATDTTARVLPHANDIVNTCSTQRAYMTTCLIKGQFEVKANH